MRHTDHADGAVQGVHAARQTEHGAIGHAQQRCSKAGVFRNDGSDGCDVSVVTVQGANQRMGDLRHDRKRKRLNKACRVRHDFCLC